MMRWRTVLDARPRAWPITVKVPLVVALLMFVVSAVLTNRVLARLETTQENHLRQLANAYMDGLTASVLPHVLRHDVWEVFDALDRAKHGYKGLDLLWTTVTSPDGSTIASSNPHAFPADTRLPDGLIRRFTDEREIIIDETENRAHTRRLLVYQDRTIGAIYADVGISQLLAERRDVLITLSLTNAVLTFALAAIGYLAVRWMMHPIRVLSRHLGRARSGIVEPIQGPRLPQTDSEFGRLFTQYNAMVHAVNERETLAARLAEEEKLASLGRLASGMAHEINNPLGGLFNAIDALKRHGDKSMVRTNSINLLQRGLMGVRDVVRAALVTYRAGDKGAKLKGADFEDLRLLIQPELRRKRLQLNWECVIGIEVNLPAAAIRDVALNLLLNACSATPEGLCVGFSAKVSASTLTLTVTDEGPGLPQRAQDHLEGKGPASAPIEDRSGLGLWMVRRLVAEMQGSILVDTSADHGTAIQLTIPLASAETMQNVA